MNTTGAAPLALLLDNRPSNHTEEVDAALKPSAAGVVHGGGEVHGLALSCVHQAEVLIGDWCGVHGQVHAEDVLNRAEYRSGQRRNRRRNDYDLFCHHNRLAWYLDLSNDFLFHHHLFGYLHHPFSGTS